jgi:hypothetical protein
VELRGFEPLTCCHASTSSLAYLVKQAETLSDVPLSVPTSPLVPPPFPRFCGALVGLNRRDRCQRRGVRGVDTS